MQRRPRRLEPRSARRRSQCSMLELEQDKNGFPDTTPYYFVYRQIYLLFFWTAKLKTNHVWYNISSKAGRLAWDSLGDSRITTLPSSTRFVNNRKEPRFPKDMSRAHLNVIRPKPALLLFEVYPKQQRSKYLYTFEKLSKRHRFAKIVRLWKTYCFMTGSDISEFLRDLREGGHRDREWGGATGPDPTSDWARHARPGWPLLL